MGWRCRIAGKLTYLSQRLIKRKHIYEYGSDDCKISVLLARQS